MSEQTETPVEWITVPEIAELLGESVSRVRRLMEDRQFVGSKRSGVLAVPAAFFADGEPLTALRGTITVLADVGFTDDELIDWLLASDETLGSSPIEAIRSGRKTEVRRVAQALA